MAIPIQLTLTLVSYNHRDSFILLEQQLQRHSPLELSKQREEQAYSVLCETRTAYMIAGESRA